MGGLLMKWISVEERLPERATNVLAWYAGPGAEAGAYRFYYSARGEWHLDWIVPPEYVTHWMPLPDPPEQSGSCLVCAHWDQKRLSTGVCKLTNKGCSDRYWCDAFKWDLPGVERCIETRECGNCRHWYEQSNDLGVCESKDHLQERYCNGCVLETYRDTSCGWWEAKDDSPRKEYTRWPFRHTITPSGDYAIYYRPLNSGYCPANLGRDSVLGLVRWLNDVIALSEGQ